VPIRVATKSRARGVPLLGIVVSATTFVALLAIIAILSATRLMENLIRGSLSIHGRRTQVNAKFFVFPDDFLDGYEAKGINLAFPAYQ
jgi:hypothetical protein